MKPLALGLVTALLLGWLRAVAADPLRFLHCNSENGMSLAAGKQVTISGIVTAQFSTGKTSRFYVQDRTGGICVFGSPKHCPALGDSVRVTGRVASYAGLTQITGDAQSPLRFAAFGRGSRPVAAFVLSPMDVRRTQQPDGCEPNESRLVQVPDVFVRNVGGGLTAPGAKFAVDTTYRLVHVGADSATNWVLIRVLPTTGCGPSNSLAGQPIPLMPVQVTGVLSQYSSRNAALNGYQILPRTRGDVHTGLGDYPEPRPPR